MSDFSQRGARRSCAKHLTMRATLINTQNLPEKKGAWGESQNQEGARTAQSRVVTCVRAFVRLQRTAVAGKPKGSAVPSCSFHIEAQFGPVVIDQFRVVILAAGLMPLDVITDEGKLRRFFSNGNLNDRAGSYVLHGGAIPGGTIGYHRTGVQQNWRAGICANAIAEIGAKKHLARLLCESLKEGHR